MDYSYNVSDLIKKIFTPTLLILGLFGNTTSILIFRKKTFKKSNTFEYLILVSFLDLCTLYTGGGQILVEAFFDVDIRLTSDYSCKIHSFLVYFFTHFSSMLLAIMSVDRTIKIVTKKSIQNSAITVFYCLAFAVFSVDFHFLIFASLVDIDNSTSFDYLSISNVSTSKTKICLCNENTAYYYYLVYFFPWYFF